MITVTWLSLLSLTVFVGGASAVRPTVSDWLK